MLVNVCYLKYTRRFKTIKALREQFRFSLYTIFITAEEFQLLARSSHLVLALHAFNAFSLNSLNRRFKATEFCNNQYQAAVCYLLPLKNILTFHASWHVIIL